MGIRGAMAKRIKNKIALVNAILWCGTTGIYAANLIMFGFRYLMLLSMVISVVPALLYFWIAFNYTGDSKDE